MHPTTRTRRFAVLTTLAALSIALAGGRAWGWGRIGHHVSARLTETLLTPATRAAILDILGPKESLADASVWPDEHRREMPESAPWHYVNVPITEPKYDARFCQAGGCVISKIADFRAQLKDPKATRDQKRLALRFLAHFVQDMHNPVHVGDRGDRGGNDLQLRFFDEGSNLHRVWDSGMIEHVDTDEAKTQARLAKAFTPEFVGSVVQGPVEGWADESLAAARDAYVDPADGQPLKAGKKLSDAYQARNLPIAERRIMQASVRLARILNETFDPAPAGR
jgi:hypothetical protein